MNTHCLRQFAGFFIAAVVMTACGCHDHHRNRESFAAGAGEPNRESSAVGAEEPNRESFAVGAEEPNKEGWLKGNRSCNLSSNHNVLKGDR